MQGEAEACKQRCQFSQKIGMDHSLFCLTYGSGDDQLRIDDTNEVGQVPNLLHYNDDQHEICLLDIASAFVHE